jgi:lipoprotein-anchoring transpeptidase ErfK/SrfK
MKRFCLLLATLLVTTVFSQAGELQIIGGEDSGGSGGMATTGNGGLIIGAIRSPAVDLQGAVQRQKSIVAFNRSLKPGSIVVDTEARFLYFVLAGKKALRYPVGVGREGKEWSGTNRISNKKQWPDWRPPQQMIERELERGIVIPEFVKGGAKNPLGARALYIGQTEFRIHGTTQPNSIGRAVSSGCIRMHNEHVIDLYNRVKIGATVVVE